MAALLFSTAIGLAGCSSGESGAQNPTQTGGTQPRAAADTKDAAPKGKPDWYTSIPKRPVTAKPGDMVVAVIVEDGKNEARIGVYKVESVAGETANLAGTFSSDKFGDVPGSLIYPVPDQTEFKPGDVVTAYAVGNNNTIGKVAKLEGGKVHVTSHYFGPDPKPEVKPLDYAIRPPSGVAPLAWVAYQEKDKWHRGMALVVDQGKVYVYKPFGAGGKIDAMDASMVKPVEIAGREYKVGETVQAYEFGSGYREATVQTVEDGGLVYSVLVTGATSPKRYFFGALTPKVG
jgi:hypothetical protein